MMSFRADRLAATSLAPAAVWVIGDVMEQRGRQALYTRQAPAVLKALRELAMVQSVESSNRIEGVTVRAGRLRPLVLGKARPQDRSEEEVRNCREALALVHRDFAKLDIAPATVQRLHAICQAGADDAGRWKRRNNEIVELVPGRAPRVRFTPLSAAETPSGIGELCRRYSEVVVREQVPPLVAVGAFVFDFLCIHPFRDGNGRASRLLTLLLLHQHGFEVGRYVNLDRIVEDEKTRYYEVLRQSSARWHEGKHAPMAERTRQPEFPQGCTVSDMTPITSSNTLCCEHASNRHMELRNESTASWHRHQARDSRPFMPRVNPAHE